VVSDEGKRQKTRVGVNGFGRIGRQVVKALFEYYPDDIEVVAYNNTSPIENNAHLFKYDSTYGRYSGSVEATDEGLLIDGKFVRDLTELDPSKIQWGDMGVEIVLETSGRFTDASKASVHVEGGAKKVIISAPSSGADSTVILGVNQDDYDPIAHRVISCGSCTTNAIVPVVKVLNDHFGVNKGLMTTVHAYTNDQRLLDGSHKDLRRARGAGQNIVPTSTGAAKAVGELLPELEGRIHGIALRVPTPTVSLVDFTAEVKQDVSVDQVNAAFKVTSENAMAGILGYSEEPLVSTDFVEDTHSCVFDALSTVVIGGNMVKVLAWYDNEWGYSVRLAELTYRVAIQGT
jgi:glyceraldehyde 3-phosphate dehydrogenase